MYGCMWWYTWHVGRSIIIGLFCKRAVWKRWYTWHVGRSHDTPTLGSCNITPWCIWWRVILCIEELHHMTSSHMYQEVIRRQKSPIFRQKSPIFRQKSHVSYVSSTWLMWYNSLMHMMRCHFMYGGVTSRDIMIYDITWHHHICIKKLYRDKRAPYSAKRAPYSAKRALYPVYRGVISHNILMHISRSYGVATIRSVGSL